MIHNKYFDILKQFAGDYKREIYGRQLIEEVPISQKGIAIALQELEREGILKSKKSGNMKFYSLNLKYSQIKEIMAITELTKKIKFCSENQSIAHIFKDDKRIVGIFGSYAKGVQKPGSDIDVFVVGSKIKNDFDKKGKPFDLDISIKYFTEKEFRELLNKKII